jgi:hypothetical protein
MYEKKREIAATIEERNSIIPFVALFDQWGHILAGSSPP